MRQAVENLPPPPLLLQYIVDKLFWPGTPLLEAVGRHEPQVDQLRERLAGCVRHALTPLLAYAQQYNPYLELANLDIKSYIE